MNPSLKLCVLPVVVVLLLTGMGGADILWLKDGDQLDGKLQNRHLVVNSLLGRIVIQLDFCKSLAMMSDQPGKVSVQTVNNDHLKGTILNGELQIERTGGKIEKIDIKLVKALDVNVSGPSYRALTTIFTMIDGSRFSGKLLTPAIEVQTAYLTASHGPGEINRIEFAAAAGGTAKILLNNGEIIQGKVLPDELEIQPDSFDRIIAVASKIKSIQFNARKLLVKEYSHDAATAAGAMPEVRQPPITDADDDGISDLSDKCPQTPTGAAVDQNGCWVVQPILFDFDSYQVKPEYFKSLNEVSAILRSNPTVRIEVRGGTDNIGTPAHNQTLSEKRALSVKNYLVRSGIKDERLIPVGHGSNNRAASNDSPAGRALNRRVDFSVVR